VLKQQNSHGLRRITDWVLQDYHHMYSKLRYVYSFCSKKKQI